MIPKRSIQTLTVKEQTQPTRTYFGLDGIDALRVSVERILNTERYRHIIYSWSYGIEIEDLYGMPHDYVALELKRRIEEALKQDDRVLAVEGYEYDRGTVRFRIISTVGDLSVEEHYDI